MINENIVPTWIEKTEKYHLKIEQVIDAYSFIELHHYQRTPLKEQFKEEYDNKIAKDLDLYCSGLERCIEMLKDEYKYKK